MVGLQYVYLAANPTWARHPRRATALGTVLSADRSTAGSHDYLEVYYATASASDQPAGQNQQHISLYGSLLPLEDLKLTANYFYFWTTEASHTTVTTRTARRFSSSLGHEIDLAAIYSYTEDVTFTMMADWFIPGNLYTSPNDATATQLVGEVKVTF